MYLIGDKLAEVPSSFEQAGHIAHMNLRDEAKPYRYLIGQVSLLYCIYEVEEVLGR